MCYIFIIYIAYHIYNFFSSYMFALLVRGSTMLLVSRLQESIRLRFIRKEKAWPS